MLEDKKLILIVKGTRNEIALLLILLSKLIRSSNHPNLSAFPWKFSSLQSNPPA